MYTKSYCHSKNTRDCIHVHIVQMCKCSLFDTKHWAHSVSLSHTKRMWNVCCSKHCGMVTAYIILRRDHGQGLHVYAWHTGKYVAGCNRVLNVAYYTKCHQHNTVHILTDRVESRGLRTGTVHLTALRFIATSYNLINSLCPSASKWPSVDKPLQTVYGPFISVVNGIYKCAHSIICADHNIWNVLKHTENIKCIYCILCAKRFHFDVSIPSSFALRNAWRTYACML